MRYLPLIVALVCAAKASASDVGTTINAGGIECRIQSQDQIVCVDNGPVCQAVRNQMEKDREKIFGCIDPKSKTYPCPPLEDFNSAEWRWRTRLEFLCGAYGHQELKCPNPGEGKCNNWWRHGNQ